MRKLQSLVEVVLHLLYTEYNLVAGFMAENEELVSGKEWYKIWSENTALQLLALNNYAAYFYTHIRSYIIRALFTPRKIQRKINGYCGYS